MPTTPATTTIPVRIDSPCNEGRAETEGLSSKKFRLSNVTNSCFVVALKQHLNTWLKLTSSRCSWNKRKAEEHRHHNQQTQPQEDKQQECQYHHLRGKWFRRISCQELSCVQQFNSTTTSPETFEKTSKAQFSSAKNVSDCKGGPRYGRKVKIVAKLLSLDLIHSGDEVNSSHLKDDNSCITRSTSLDSGCFSIAATSFASEHSGSVQEFVKHLESSTLEEANATSTPIITTNTAATVDKMTIWDDSYSEVRKEYPDLDAEIRSILTARAQEGATITEIREDYHNLTGVVFPVCESITDFLLSIPYVSAYCNEDGIRIFNIRPTEKTKHIYDMVVYQKQPQEPVQKSYKSIYRSYYRGRQRTTHYNPTMWRKSSIFRNQKTQEENSFYQQYPQPVVPQLEKQRPLVQQVEKLQTVANKEPYYIEAEQQQQPAVICNDKNVILANTEDYIDHDCCFDDNCKYGLNNMCSAQNRMDPSSVNPPYVYTWEEQEQHHHEQQQRQLFNIDKEPLPNVAELNNLNANPTCYDNNINHLNSIFYKANPNNVLRRSRNSINGPPPQYSSRSPTVKSYSANDSLFTDSDYEAHLLDFLLLGDDFLLYMARMELKCKFRKNQRVLQSGLCVSGQTIDAAIRRIINLNISGRSVIVNIGSVNVLQGRQLIQIEHEYRELIKIMMKRGIKPILTTLAPLANYIHNNELKLKLERFNEWIKREGKRLDLVVIDIWKCLMNAKGHVLFDCYQHEPRLVTGAKEPYLFWNKIGRQRVLRLIESHLEY